MKPTVLITKIGSVYRTRALAEKSSKVGEQGETEGIINHLRKRDDINLVYFGQYRGEAPAGLTVINSYIEDLDDLSTHAQQQRCWDYDIKNVAPYKPKFFIHIAGYASTMSVIKNPNAAAVQAAGIRYVAPSLNILQAFKLPRIVINNDPRSYPREGEMTCMWDWVRPRALLSQRAADWSRIIYGRKYEVREVYAGAENWCEYIREEPINDIPCGCIAHAHIKDGCKQRGRDIAFANIFNPKSDMEDLIKSGFKVYGKGWEHFSEYDPSYMFPPIRPNEVGKFLARIKTCPAVAAGDNFYTGKLRTCLAQDCLPLFYGQGEPFTFDSLGKYIQIPHALRIAGPGDLLRVVRYFDGHEEARSASIKSLWEQSKPDFTLLDDCIADVLNGRDMTTESWWQQYGGYR